MKNKLKNEWGWLVNIISVVHISRVVESVYEGIVKNIENEYTLELLTLNFVLLWVWPYSMTPCHLSMNECTCSFMIVVHLILGLSSINQC